MPKQVKLGLSSQIVSRPDREDPGLVQTTSGATWLFHKAPSMPVLNAMTDQERDNAARPMEGMFRELAIMSSGLRKVRSSQTYRRFQIFSTTLPEPFSVPDENPNAQRFRTEFKGVEIDVRAALFGVLLKPSIRGRGLKGAVESVAGTLMQGGTSIEDYSVDIRRIRRLFDRYGFVVPTTDEVSKAEGYLNDGQWADNISLPHGDHIHVFRGFPAAQAADRAMKQEIDCLRWGADLDGHRVYTMCCLDSVKNIDIEGGPDSSEVSAAWAARLARHGAVAISVSGMVEPAPVTRNQMRINRRTFQSDQEAAERAGKMSRAEAEEKQAILRGTEELYAKGAVSPTLTDLRISVCMDGQYTDTSEVSRGSGTTLIPRTGRQNELSEEIRIAHESLENPNVKDWPSINVSAAGLADVSAVGDDPRVSPVILGLGEEDTKPVYWNPSEAVDDDTAPFSCVTGSTGSGKTMLLLRMAMQIATGGGNVVSIGPKPMAKSPKPLLDQVGGRLADLSDLTSADGVMDAFRTTNSKEQQVSLAASYLASVNPFGTADDLARMETQLKIALRYGADNGARSTGSALRMAAQAGHFPQDVADKVILLAKSDPQFRAFVGIDDGSERMADISGWVHIQVGKTGLELPEPGVLAAGRANQAQRIAVTLVRAMVNSCIYALQSARKADGSRGGSIFLDEAWTFILAGKEELDRAGRVCREYGVDIVLFNQKISEAVDAGLTGYFKRGIILPMDDEQEAIAALEVVDRNLYSPKRVERLQMRGSLGDPGNEIPNWASMRALWEKDPQTGEQKNVRGTIAIVRDYRGNVGYVEIALPRQFLEVASTSASSARKSTSHLAVDAVGDQVAAPPVMVG